MTALVYSTGIQFNLQWKTKLIISSSKREDSSINKNVPHTQCMQGGTAEIYHSKKSNTEARVVVHAQVNDKKHSIPFFVLRILFASHPATEHVS